jgi:hypothetical protein
MVDQRKYADWIDRAAAELFIIAQDGEFIDYIGMVGAAKILESSITNGFLAKVDEEVE